MKVKPFAVLLAVVTLISLLTACNTPEKGDRGNIGDNISSTFAPITGELQFAVNTPDTYYLVSYSGNDRYLTIPSTYNGYSVTEIGNAAFQNNNSVKVINISGNVSIIGSAAFSGCKSLTRVTLPDTVTSIGDFAFQHCDSLTSIVIPNSVTSISSGMFYGCDNLTSITIPDSVTSIGDSAFQGCNSLARIVIPNSVTSIGINAFSGCNNSFLAVFYGGTETEWNDISTNPYTGIVLPNDKTYYYSETAPAESGNYWHYVDGVPTPW